MQRGRCNSAPTENTSSGCRWEDREVRREGWYGTLRNAARLHPALCSNSPPAGATRRWLQTAHKPLVIISSKSVVGSTGTFPTRFRVHGNSRARRKGGGTTESIRCAAKRNNILVYIHRIPQKWSTIRQL